MALSNSQYDSIMRMYYQRQYQNKHNQDARIEEVYAKIPEIRRMNEEIGRTSVESARKLLEGGENVMEHLRDKLLDLKEGRKALLLSHDYPPDYLDLQYVCADCRDTGYTENKKCHCFRQAEIELLYAQSNIRDILERENFNTFSYEYFERDQVDARSGKTAWDYMHQVVKQCRDYITGFETKKGNLLFTGSTGLGKTFLSHCIAKELIARSYSVVYLSATDLFDVLSKNKFDYHAAEETRDMYQYILDCDLLIADDLGTELINTFTTSQLFYCVNERLIRKKGTIISTNLPVNRMRDEFTDRVTSRLMSQYTIIPLYGQDIRIQKKIKGID